MIARTFGISLFTAVLTGVFAVLVWRRYLLSRRKHRQHLAAWGVGLMLYSVSMAAQAILFYQWHGWLFKLWYWAGALAVAAWLGQGTLFLLVRKRRVWLSFWLVVALTAAGFALIFAAPLDSQAFTPGVDLTEQYKAIFATSEAARVTRTVLVILMNTYGTLLLVGGAAYSAWIFRRKAILPHRVAGNVLIAAGGLLPALAGTLILLGRPEYKYLGQMLGGILLFAGFLVATSARAAVSSNQLAVSSEQ